MRVARLVEVGKPFEVGTADKPVPGPRDVLVKVDACSFVPNTANLVKNKDNPFILQDLPAVFGLDAAGTIEAVGSQVLNLKVGDRVYVNPFLSCGTCHHCRRGRPNICPDWCLRAYFTQSEAGKQVLARYPIGGLAEYLLSPDEKIAVLPPSISTAFAARFGYLGTSYGALKKANVGPGKTVLINGVTGTLGVGGTLIALGFGATKVLGVGRNPDRLKEVASLSPRVHTRSSEEDGSIADWVLEQTGGLGVDAVYDCLGVGGDANTTQEVIKKAVKRGGTVILVAGSAEGKLGGTYADFMMREVTILGSAWFTDGEVDEMIALIDAGVIDVSKYENKAFALDDVNKAIEAVGNRPGGFVNVIVKPGQ